MVYGARAALEVEGGHEVAVAHDAEGRGAARDAEGQGAAHQAVVGGGGLEVEDYASFAVCSLALLCSTSHLLLAFVEL